MWAVASAAAHALVVQAEQPASAVILALELVVCRTVVPAAEFFLGVESGGVQRLVPVERADLRFHHPVVITVALPGRERHGAPEAEVDVHVARLHRVHRPRAVAAQPQRAHPHRGHLYVLLEHTQTPPPPPPRHPPPLLNTLPP